MKNKKNHIGIKIKRLRSYNGITQEELALSIGKTRSLISHIERTGIINRYTLKEIAVILKINPEEFDLSQPEMSITNQVGSNFESEEFLKNKIGQLQEEIHYLKDVINKQWELLKKNK